jgi:hypothetical protein
MGTTRLKTARLAEIEQQREDLPTQVDLPAPYAEQAKEEAAEPEEYPEEETWSA